jgi:hypothetical protein
MLVSALLVMLMLTVIEVCQSETLHSVQIFQDASCRNPLTAQSGLVATWPNWTHLTSDDVLPIDQTDQTSDCKNHPLPGVASGKYYCGVIL